ncbi:MAG: copper-binding protein, partial [Acidobacterium ailaaui]|nr:copper-binding protein [Pseudacidobacterium ailaaui]
MADFFHQGLRFGRIKEWEHTKSVNWAVAFSSRQLCVVAFTCFLLAGGCRRTAPEAGQSASEAGAKHYPVRGKIVTVDPQHGEIVLDAAAIPGYMEAMTMPYKLKNPSILGELHPGDSITATLIATEDSDL